MTQSALILFAHGARNASWAAPFERLRALTQIRMPGVTVSLAYLELMTPRLPEMVAELAAAGVKKMTVVPVFLGQGGHLLRDLPRMLGQLQTAFPDVQFDVVPAAGEAASVLNAIADYCVAAVAKM